jgi:hypothetical protein
MKVQMAVEGKGLSAVESMIPKVASFTLDVTSIRVKVASSAGP